MRLNRFLAQCGLGSRRKCEELIQSGRVKINGIITTNLATQVEKTDRVYINDQAVAPLELRYVILNKPSDFITTMREQFGRKKVSDLLNDPSVKPVGRLDMTTTGVLIMTNDGELAFRLTHPKYAIARVYQATISGDVSAENKSRIAAGIDVGDGQIAHGRILASRYLEGYSRVTIELKEGLNREVRRIFETLGHKVISLDRISFGGLLYAGLERGQWRNLTEHEVSHLKKLVGLE
ncbi:MAG: rRNA pseudouridine synthase [Candidatus Marinimicrobia bacterium]|jgi:pseudouridine synthase|nr:rRNA pseudouridine synthase [Candidatus Neomarinimicrobiota bacterium]MCK9483048.1 rRNA pseudouridine synthase [Candidatus Neomarinimicrobiota bacterium]MCK9559080.1 rRNA pseudouridine synthase [Candidatus Neomarinimicrobiota bacterium]MDD5540273.1 pseudouridine synthase [Candidatus Neomarinimicrobiota bacterium]